MGGLCSAPAAPTVDMNEVAELVQKAVEEIPVNSDKNEREFPEEIKKADPNPFIPPDTKGFQLTKASTPEDIRKAAIASACGGQVRDAIKDQVWKQIEPKVSEQIPEGTNSIIKDNLLKAAQKPVDAAVDKAVDEMLNKLNEGKKDEKKEDKKAN